MSAVESKPPPVDGGQGGSQSAPFAKIGYLVMTAFALFSFGSVLMVTTSLGLERAEILRIAEYRLGDQAGLVAEALNGVFRSTDHVLAGLARLFNEDLRVRPETGRKLLAAASESLPEAEGLWLLDVSGETIAAAGRVASPRPPEWERIDLRLRSGALADAALVPESQGPRDQAKLILIARRMETAEGTYLGAAVVVYSERLLDWAVLNLLGAEVERMEISDRTSGAVLGRDIRPARSGDPPRASTVPVHRTLFSEPGGGELVGSRSLRSQPFAVTLYKDRKESLADWKLRFDRNLVASLVLLLFAGIALAYGLISARKEARNQELSKELAHRDLLFHELNHRVKNNLAVVRSLLSLAETSLPTSAPAELAVLRTAADRIDALAAVHERLYQTQSLSETDLGPFLAELANSIADGYGQGRPIELKVEAEGGIYVNLATAVPCALILNELVTNAYKYAFPECLPGLVSVRLRAEVGGGFSLAICDDGVGIAATDAAPEGHVGFGLVLVDSLAAQLKATLVREDGEAGRGLSWLLKVPPQPKQACD